MNKKAISLWLAICSIFFIQSTLHAAVEKANESTVFTLDQPDYKTSPYTGMTRKHWVDAATYLLEGAFSYIHSLDDPMKFPKQEGVSYPRNDGQIPTEKLEGLCRTLYVAMPLLKENPDLTLNNIKVADYYRHQLINLITPGHPSFIKPRAKNGGPSQILVEFGALAISLFAIPEVLWEPLTQEQKDKLAATMISYGDGPTVPSNWRFFNIFVLSFFKEQGYEVNEKLMTEYLDKSLAQYRGDGWYNDNPAYDYYSMWAFQMYGVVWSEFFGKKYLPDYAQKFMTNFKDMVHSYPYMFGEDGKMIMWGRSITYRFGAIVPFPLMGYLHDSNVNYGWMRRIASSTLLQFLQHPDFLKDGVPTLGFYGPFEPSVQGYSCRGSVYWSGKAFIGLLLPETNIFWKATENEGAWADEFKQNKVYNHFQQGSEILVTDYPNSGAAEIRAWCHVPYITSWEKFRASENYNRLAYSSAFTWMADGKDGEVAMNYAIKNKKDEWEVLRLFTFRKFEDGIYYRDAVLETDSSITFRLADIPLPNGILRVDRVSSLAPVELRLGHYSLPERNTPVTEIQSKVNKENAYIIGNGKYQLATISLQGWSHTKFVHATGLHPESNRCTVLNTTDRMTEGDKIYITLHLWKKGNKPFTKKELSPVKEVKSSPDGKSVYLTLQDGSKKTVYLH